MSPAMALEIGDAQVNSSLGQPLRANVSYTLGPNEALASSCVSLQGGASASGLPSVTSAQINVANGVISILGSGVVREPLMSMRLNVRCPYTPQLSRDYMLFIDPAPPVMAPAAEPASATTTSSSRPAAIAPAAAVAAPARSAAPAPAPRRRPAVAAPISDSVRYRVQPGDSLSMIAQRIENRPIGLWEAVGVIFDANPDAFIDNDPNKLMAGSWLEIPDFGSAQIPSVAGNGVFEPATSVSATAATADAGVSAVDATLVDLNSQLEPDVTESLPADAALASSASDVVDLTASEEAIDADSPFVTPGNETVVIPDTEIEGPETLSSSPNVPVARVQTSATEESSTSLVAWIIGGAIALLVGSWLLLSRRPRRPLGSTPIAPVAEAPHRRSTDGFASEHHEDAVAPSQAVAYADEWAVDDDAPTEENLVVDADLVVGTGLTAGHDMDMSRDFGFAATTELDIELPEEMSSGAADLPETDILEPLNVEMQTILESEVLPESDDDDDYDMSVIMDATKMPMPEDVTERDFAAIQVDTDADTINEGDYTLSQEIDYKILEQDYEDEMTATQALNQEIAKAAQELALQRDAEDESDEEPTAEEMSLASVTALEVTAMMPSTNDSDDNENPDIDESATLRIDSEDNTVEMPARDDGDDTAEMPIKRKRGSRSA